MKLIQKALLFTLLACYAHAQAPIPANYQALFNLDQQTWNTCGSCGDSGGGGALAKYGASVGANQYSEDGFDTSFWIVPNARYENAYFWQEHTAPAGALLYASYEFDLYIPDGQQSAPQAIEFEIFQRLNGWVYDGGWQIDYADGAWRTFDYVAHEWKATTIPFEQFSADTWHHLAAEYHTEAASHTIFFDSLQIDGKKYWLNLWHAAFWSGNLTNKFTHAFQLDGNANATPYSVNVDKMEMRVVSATK